MKRKDFLRLSGSLAIGSVTTAPVLLNSSCTPRPPELRTEMTEKDIALLNDIGETILPSTEDVPGAKAAKIGDYIFMMYSDMMKEDDKLLLVDGFHRVDTDSYELFKNDFVNLEKDKKEFLIQGYQNEALVTGQQKSAGLKTEDHFFNLIKGLTLSGYFSSEVGMTQARVYVPIPGKFIGCVPLKDGQKPWA